MKIPTAKFVFDRKHVSTRSTARGRKKGLVQIVVMHLRERRYFGTGVKLYSDQWRDDTERHVVNSAYASEYNRLLDTIMQSILRQIDEQTQAGFFDLAKFTIGADRQDVMSMSDLSLMMQQEKVGVSESTLKAYSVIRNSFDRFRPFDNIYSMTSKDITEYEKAMDAKGISATTIHVRMSHAKSLLAFAVQKGILVNNVADCIKLRAAKTKEIVYLTDEEIGAIARLDLHGKLEAARDIFLFQCYTGMAWADIATLNRSMIQTQGADTFISRSRKKTQIHYRIKLLSPAKAILDRHGGMLPLADIGVYSTYSLYVKDIVKMAGIKKSVNTHVGRHTFATWALSHGTPIEIVSKMLGHTKIETTQIYAKVLAKDVEAQFDKLDELFKG